jgi:hypothetical protein
MRSICARNARAAFEHPLSADGYFEWVQDEDGKKIPSFPGS